MRFAVSCRLDYRVEAPTTFLFNIQPARLEQQAVLRERLTVTPDAPVEPYLMPESGNRYVRFGSAPGELTVDYQAEVELRPQRQDPATVGEIPFADLPFEVMPHLHPSRYCQSDKLTRLVEQEFGGLEPGHSRVGAVCNWIYEHVAYVRGSSDVHTSAHETLVERAGVCRDFAHLGIALCRALGIPARYVSCYAWQLDPADFHAVFEAYLGGRWHLFDPTRQAALDGLVRIGIGRDASEVAFASIYGAAEPTGMAVRIEATDGADISAERTVMAISTSAT